MPRWAEAIFAIQYLRYSLLRFPGRSRVFAISNAFALAYANGDEGAFCFWRFGDAQLQQFGQAA